MTKGDAGFRSGARTLTGPVLREMHLRLATMASKMRYWKCVDCNSMINDENMHEIEFHKDNELVVDKYAEFCYGCMNYYPHVVIAYR